MSGERVAPGARIGDYTIERALRSEPTGVVYAGVHVVLPRRAAIKIGAVLREACILEALSHPGVPRIYECGVLAGERPWVAIERIDGTVLADAMSDSPIAIADLVIVVRAVADILAHAHARGVGHHRLGEGVVALTPGRATPVCVRGWGDVVPRDSPLAAGPASDVHSLGALAYRALTGAVLTPAPAELTQLIDDMLSGDPDARPSAAEVCERVDSLDGGDFAVRIRG